MIPSIEYHDRRIAMLTRMLSAEKRARKSLVAKAELQRRHQDPAFREKFRKARRAKDIASGRALPDMTDAQHAQYLNFKQHYGMTRAQALAVVLGNSAGHSPPQCSPVPLSPTERAPRSSSLRIEARSPLEASNG